MIGLEPLAADEGRDQHGLTWYVGADNALDVDEAARDGDQMAADQERVGDGEAERALRRLPRRRGRGGRGGGHGGDRRDEDSESSDPATKHPQHGCEVNHAGQPRRRGWRRPGT